MKFNIFFQGKIFYVVSYTWNHDNTKNIQNESKHF